MEDEELKTHELIDKIFGQQTTILFDFVDHIKVKYNIQRKGLSYIKREGRYLIYAESEDGESVLLDALDNSQGYKLELYISAFST